MAKINIQIEATLQAFSNFADELGYQAQVVNPDYIPAERNDKLEVITPEVGDPTIGNPETKAAFLARSIKQIIATALADRAVRAVEQIKRDEVKTESEQLRKAIENAITVT